MLTPLELVARFGVVTGVFLLTAPLVTESWRRFIIAGLIFIIAGAVILNIT